MEQKVPRLVLAGTNSGCGKTTVTCAVLQALVTRGLRVGAAKCGPDYIDPMFHSRVIGAKSSNLDSFFFDRDTMRYLLAHNTQGCDVTVIEGVMGYYDGLGLTSTRASTYAAARETSSPVVLVVNARGAALSVLASVEGFLHFAPDSGIQGVILNGCSAMSYGPLSRELENRLGVRACGYLPRLPECALESRHLGLITADEVADLQEKLRRLAAEAEKTLDIAALLEIAAAAPPLRFTPPVLPEAGAPVRIGVARDRAFCFYYEDSLDLLRQLGAELDRARGVKASVFATLGKWLKAECILLAVTFCQLLVGLLLIRQEYALLLAALIALIDALPVFGTGTVLAPWAAVECLLGNVPKGAALLALFAVISVVRSVLEPKLVAAQAGLPPLASLAAMYVGFCAAGVAGMVLAPVLLLLVKQLRDGGYIRLWR